MKTFHSLSEYDKGWVIGMLEGEGTFVTHKRTRGGRIEVSSDDPETPIRLQELLGGKIYGPYKDRISQKWSLQRRKEVIELGQAVKEYLCPRRQKAIKEMLANCLRPKEKPGPKR